MKSYLTKTIIIVLCLLAAPYAFGAESDDFSAGSLGGHWAWLNTPSTYDLTSRPDWLHVQGELNNNFWQSDISGHLLYQSVTENFTIETCFECTPTTEYQQAHGRNIKFFLFKHFVVITVVCA